MMYACQRLATPGFAPEDIAILPSGELVTGLADGRIIRVNAQTGASELIVKLHGRPLGIEVQDETHLIVCDGQLGQLLQINIQTGAVRVLVEQINGKRIRLCNNASIARDGRIFFSTSSQHYAVNQWQMDLIQHPQSGALHCLHPDGHVGTLLSGLAFANGVTLTADESRVLVAETGRNQVMQVNLKSLHVSLFNALPGVPDNMSTDRSGMIWVAIPSAADWRLTWLKKLPYRARIGLAHTIGRLKMPVKQHGQILGYNSYGRLVHNIEVDPAKYHMITGVREHNGILYLGSLHEEAIGIVQL
jgi:sugar lactone lactonase YvrE